MTFAIDKLIQVDEFNFESISLINSIYKMAVKALKTFQPLKYKVAILYQTL